MAGSAVGVDHPMADARDRVVGTIRFTVDHQVPGMLHARLVTSQSPHGLIRKIDTAEALRVPGVVAVLTGKDLEQSAAIPNPYFGVSRRDQPGLAIGKVRYAGEPVAIVLAETIGIAREAAVLVDVDYDDLPYVTEPWVAAEEGAPVVHDEWPRNECGEWHLHKGDVDRAFAEAAHVHETIYKSPSGSQVPLEPHVAVARWDDGRLEIWSSTQWPSAVQAALAHMLEKDLSDVRVHALPLGGGYGAKGQVKIEPLVAAAAVLVGRPVRLELDRTEVYLTVCKHEARIRMRSAFTEDGTLLARDIDLIYNAGAYGVTDPGAAGNALVRANGPYRIPDIRIRSRSFYTNSVPSGSYRGAMTNQVAFAYESHSDEIAALLGMDPVAFRRKNLLVDGDSYATGEVMHDVHFGELLDEVAREIGWGEESPEVTGGSTGVTRRGKGVAVILKTTPTPTRTECRVEVCADGRAIVYSSSVDMGQGAASTIAQLAADALGIDYDLVEVVAPDTHLTPFDTMTAGSRTTYCMDQALRDAARVLRASLAKLASGPDLGPPGEGFVEILRSAGLSSVSEVGVYQGVGGEGMTNPADVRGHTTVHWHQGAVAAEVEVDLETGKIQVLRCHGASWAGRVINPTRVRQQNEGCMIMGIGPTLFEELQVVDGQVVNPNFSDYLIPSILDVPVALTSAALVSEDPDAELHGVGEMTIPATSPAIANAVYQATGVRVTDLPLTPERVLRAIRAASDEAR
jgi:CO/xanthine dehydrogenase Mo-binding subunit